jgi:hypothetical protein
MRLSKIEMSCASHRRRFEENKSVTICNRLKLPAVDDGTGTRIKLADCSTSHDFNQGENMRISAICAFSVIVLLHTAMVPAHASQPATTQASDSQRGQMDDW